MNHVGIHEQHYPPQTMAWIARFFGHLSERKTVSVELIATSLNLLHQFVTRGSKSTVAQRTAQDFKFMLKYIICSVFIWLYF